nr:MAG TPA: hypothetical protein [Caudoviricetes sp.]
MSISNLIAFFKDNSVFKEYLYSPPKSVVLLPYFIESLIKALFTSL